jgi:hypothetical protein
MLQFQAIRIPDVFREYNSLESVTFESDWVLREIGEEEFCGSGLRSIIISTSVEMMSNAIFSEYERGYN